MRSASAVLTEQELEIMKIIWEQEKVTVRDVYEALLKKRKIAYTTVMTMMNILEQKKHLKKSRAEKAYLYRATRPKRKVIGEMVRDFVGRVFDGSAEPLLLQLVQDRHLREEDLEEIQNVIRESRERGER